MSGIRSNNGWREAAIAWEVCASLHRQYCKGKDALFTTRQSDFVKHAEDAREYASRGQASVQQGVQWQCGPQASGFTAPQAGSQPAPIDMVLHCPACGLQHIDGREYQHGDHTAQNEAAAWNWDNPPHRSHLCHGCGHIWRPADVPTNGVRAVKSAGKADSPIAARAPADSVTAPAGPGWKTVPVEPTEAMFTRFSQQIEEGVVYVGGFLQAYRCMLAAAPTPPAQAADSVLEDAASEVLMEHSGCGGGTQVDMLTVRLNPGDKVVMFKGPYSQAIARAAMAAKKGGK